MRLFILFNALFLFLPSGLFSQTIRFSGALLDSETQAPVSLINIFTGDRRYGTTSSAEGKFSLNLPASYENSYLYFSSIDYETDSLLISRSNLQPTIYLTPKIYTLTEIYVIPDSTLLTLLRRAYSKIPENYPASPTRYRGFYQESTSDENGDLIKLVEAELAVYKEAYDKKREAPGQVEILKSRIKQLQATNLFSVDGAFLSVDADGVLQRSEYINPSHFKDYNYDFLGIKSLKGKECYSIEFRSARKDSISRGEILIDKESLAYISFETESDNPGNSQSIIGVIKPVETKKKIVYEQLNGKWHLKHVSSRAKHEHWRLKSVRYSSADFITTTIQTDSVIPIPVYKRLGQMNPIELITDKYDPKGWTDSDILAGENQAELGFQFSTDEASAVFNQNVRPKLSFAQTVMTTLPKIIMGFGASYSQRYDLFAFQMTLGYRLNQKWSIQGQYAEDLYHRNRSLTEFDLGIEYRKNLNNAGYQLFGGVSLWGSHTNIDGGPFNHVREQAIAPQLSLSKRTSRYFTFELFAKYPFIINSNHNNIKNYPQFGINLYVY
ncbi:MAG: carboxypeptidase-like regulatory domain-containing protein [Tannerella sp.]|jgi:hypothetical protein|nr:carboxypeptidase-like regulatory domain-containing protein [Tannerella sp.]